MTTLNSAIQTLVNNLETKMLSNVPLSAEEQTLIAGAIDKLAQHASLEQAVVAVAEEHLESAEDSLTEVVNAAKADLIQQVSEVKTDLMEQVTEAKNTMVSQLTDAKNALNSTLTTASSSMNAAQQDIDEASQTLATQNQHLTLIPEVKAGLQAVGDTVLSIKDSSNNESVQALISKTVFGVKAVEVHGKDENYARSSAIFAVYDANGDTHAIRPSFVLDGAENESARYEHIEIDKNAIKTTINTHFVQTHSIYEMPSTYIHGYGCSAVVPLGLKNQPNNIAFELVYSLQSRANDSSADYKGVYVRAAGSASVTKPKQNLNVVDQWGLTTKTSHEWGEVGVLYDNKKHCLVMVDFTNSRIIEKYRDGNLVTQINISNEEALQKFVNEGDFTVVYFISNQLSWATCALHHYDGAYATHYSDLYDAFGFFGLVGSNLKMGGRSFSAHYRFTENYRLEPLNYHFISFVEPYFATSEVKQSITGTSYMALTDFQGKLLGQYRFNVSSNQLGGLAGYFGNAIVCMNPVSNTGLLNSFRTDTFSTHKWHGIGRTCKAY